MAKKPSAQKATATKKRKAPAKSKATSAKRAGPTKRKVRPAKKRPATAAPVRRAVFVDVENTSSESDLLKVLDHLKIDRKVQPTELYALGNWKSVGTRVARTLASLGAQLIHSAPAVGVRDWSDLWIAVAAGRWLASATPGDIIDIVSDDRAFDAVGDAAAAAGVVFRRTSYRTIPSAAAPPPAPETRPRRRRRGGRGRRPLLTHPSPAQRPQTTPSPAPEPPEPEPQHLSDEEAHGASHAQISATLGHVAGGTSRWVNLDALANALKTAGFTRPPGSPRLVTRLRKMKDVEVSANGMVRLVSGAAEALGEPATAIASPARRPRRRGGRGRRRPRTDAAADAPTPSDNGAPEE
jgi:hypothetical protein